MKVDLGQVPSEPLAIDRPTDRFAFTRYGSTPERGNGMHNSERPGQSCLNRFTGLGSLESNTRGALEPYNRAKSQPSLSMSLIISDEA